MSKVKVLHFAKTFNSDDFVDVVLNFADNDKFDMYAAVYNRRGNPKLPNPNAVKFPLYSIGIDHGYLSLFVGAWSLSKILRKEKIQILHTHHFYESIIGFLACLLYSSCRHIVGRHYHNEFYLTAKGIKLSYYLKVEAFVNSRAKFIVSPSSMITALLITQGVEKNKIKQIPYGFDFNAPKFHRAGTDEISEIRSELGITGYFCVGNFGRHHQIKGQLFLLESIDRLCKKGFPFKLIMVGDGPYRGEIENFINQKGLGNNIILLGWRSDVSRLVSAMDAIVHPTLQEAFPQIMIETMALGIPLIISKVSGATDVVKHEGNGILVNTRESKEIDHYLLKIYENPEWAAQLAKNGQRIVKRDYDIHSIIKQYELMYLLALQDQK